MKRVFYGEVGHGEVEFGKRGTAVRRKNGGGRAQKGEFENECKSGSRGVTLVSELSACELKRRN